MIASLSNPSTDPRLREELSAGIRAARSAQAAWASTSVGLRMKLFRRLRSILAREARLLATSSATLRDRPLAEVLSAEVFPLIEACRFLERRAAAILAPRKIGAWGRPLWLGGVRGAVQREPFGVILIIGPANYPLMLPGIQMLQALAAGNAVWIKPAPGCAAPMVQLVGMVVAAGLDPELLRVLPDRVDVASLAMSLDIGKVLFTGSTLTGERVLGALAPRCVPATLELSGVDSVLVRADADLELVADALAFGLRLNAGETCLAPRRVLVPPPLMDGLEGLLATRLRSVPSNAFSATVARTLSPLWRQAIASGARCVVGGEDRGPAVLSGVSPESPLLRSNLFAPLLLLVAVADEDEAVRCANDSPYGLGASVFTRNVAAGWSLARRIRVGVVTINDLIVPTGDARLPFGGRGRSGFGVTRGPEGLLELTTPKVITYTGGRSRPAFEPPQPGDEELFCGYLRCAHATGWLQRWRGLVEILRRIGTRKRSQTDL